MLKKLPNYLTLLRIALAPFLIVFFSNNIIAVGIFIFAALTDWVDGHIARKYEAKSAFGALVDPLADKILVTTALVMLCSYSGVPPWLVIVMLSREFLVTGLRGAFAVKGVVVPASRLAKYKTATTMVAIPMLIYGEPLFTPGMVVLYVSLAISVISAKNYYQNYQQLLDD